MAGHSVQARNDAVNGMGKNANGGAGAHYVALHENDPGLTGAAELAGGAYIRKLITTPDAAGGSMTTSQAIIDVPAGKTVRFWSRYTAATGGTFYQSGALPAEESFGTAGQYTLALQYAHPA